MKKGAHSFCSKHAVAESVHSSTSVFADSFYSFQRYPNKNFSQRMTERVPFIKAISAILVHKTSFRFDGENAWTSSTWMHKTYPHAFLREFVSQCHLDFRSGLVSQLSGVWSMKEFCAVLFVCVATCSWQSEKLCHGYWRHRG